ncbi:unnamed protein product [Chrysoparadoxa australica]
MAGYQGARRGSNSDEIVSAARRLSLSSMMRKGSDIDPAKEEAMIKARDSRRRSSLIRFGLTDSVQKSATAMLANIAQEEVSGDTPKEKLQNILTKAKEGGLSAEKLFEFFAPNGEGSISGEAFEKALNDLNPDHFSLSKAEMAELIEHFDSNNNGLIELSEFMEFCMDIPCIPWKAEKARRLRHCDSSDSLAEAARTIERRRTSSVRSISKGDMLHKGSKFFWRSKENIDIAIYENREEGIISIWTHSHEYGTNYHPIYLDSHKLPVHASQLDDAVKAKLDKRYEAGELHPLDEEGLLDLREKARSEIIVEYVLNRLKVPDSANAPTSPERSKGGANKVDKAYQPFLQRLSTDKDGSVRIRESITIENPFKFPSNRRSSAADFRRMSADFSKLAADAEHFIHEAQENVAELESQVAIAKATASASREEK